MKPFYIHSAVSISAQKTSEGNNFLPELIPPTSKIAEAVHPDYTALFPAGERRRMATGVKMAVAAAQKAMDSANFTNIDATITGSGMGCMEDTEKFLNALLENNEAHLSPTPFIQSTHNTVAATIALKWKQHGYNTTYVNGSVSFENALLDAQLFLVENTNAKVLLGSVDELGKEFVDYVLLLEEQKERGIKVPLSEGASFFVISNEKENAIAKMVDVKTSFKISKGKICISIEEFLSENNLTTENVDVLICGNNGDEFDGYYTEVSSIFNNCVQLQYKKFSGEYFTVSGFAFWLGTTILQEQTVPTKLIVKNSSKSSFKTVLIYNQWKGEQHSFVLLSSC